jgi:hypothetical protein
MRPAGRFYDAAIGVERGEAAIGIRLQDAGKGLQVRVRPLSFTVG